MTAPARTVSVDRRELVHGLRTVAVAKVYVYLGFPGLGSGRCGFNFLLGGQRFAPDRTPQSHVQFRLWNANTMTL
jgi:hypothetical protein